MSTETLIKKIALIEQEIRDLEGKAQAKRLSLLAYKDALMLVSANHTPTSNEPSLFLDQDLATTTNQPTNQVANNKEPRWERLRCGESTKRVYEIIRDSEFGMLDMSEITAKLQAEGRATNRHTVRAAIRSGKERGIVEASVDGKNYHITKSGEEFLKELDKRSVDKFMEDL